MKYVTNNGVNMLLLVFELLDISLFPLQRKKMTKTPIRIRWCSLDYNKP